MAPRVAILTLSALLFASAAGATTHVVLPDGSGDFPRIQDAIDAAVSGDEIALGDGTFTGLRNRNLDFLGKNITLRSQSGDPALCVIDCEGQHRGLSIKTGETAAVVEGITIRNGFAPGTTTIPGAPGTGGGIVLSGTTSTFRRCVIARCSADDAAGAAIAAGAYAINSRVTFEDCAFIENFFPMRGTGAGLFAWGNSNVTATRCRFLGNRAPGVTSGGSGGGIRAQDSRLTLVDCVVAGNMADIGAGISTGEACLIDFSNCLVAGNSNNTTQGSSQAAGIQIGYDTDGIIRSCTIAGNRAFNRGAGLTVANDCILTIEKTVIWGNCIGAGQGEAAYVAFDGVVDFVCSDVDPAKVVGGTVTYTNSLAVDPFFCAPEPCANAPTLNGAYTLNTSSPLLNAPGCGLIGRSGAGCGVADIPRGAVAANGLSIRCGPNPFRESTTLHYSIPETGPVVIDLFDAAGRLIARFDEGTRQPGSYAIQWGGLSRDGARVRPGVYFARLSSRGLAASDWLVHIE
jgi:Right handed beta helix region